MPDQEHKQYIDGKICEIEECPKCEGLGEREYQDPYDPSGTMREPCARCDARGYIKK